MGASSATSVETITLDFVPGEAFRQIQAALPGCPLRFAPRRHELEIPTLIQAVSWASYEAILDAFGDRRFPHTYDRGTLEIMSPKVDHDWVKRLIGRMIEAMCFALNISIKSVGSSTLRRPRPRTGLEPDESYYIANEPRVRGKMTYDPNLDPPPDLAIEVDVTSKSLERLPVYAELRVPEVWRWDGRDLLFYRRKRTGAYTEVKRSVAFPFVAPTDVARCLDLYDSTDENGIVRAFVEWAKQAHKQHSL
jgi:Uma2 family endonuclease